MTTVTQWFDGATQPAHKGWYERQVGGSAAFWYFDKTWKRGGYVMPLSAASSLDSPSQYIPWRGLAEKPQP